MRIRRLTLANFRGVKRGMVDFTGHTLLVGGNNAGKSTVCEAIDLVLGPERLYRRPPIDEHDFHRGRHFDDDGKPAEIRIDATLLDLSEEAERRFAGSLRRWSERSAGFVDELGGEGNPDAEGTCWALPVAFLGRYNPDEDDFEGNTFFAHPVRPVDGDDARASDLGAGLKKFSRDHKRLCGFVFLRALRTGSRALSLQRGSLLDTVLRLGDKSLHTMWLDTLERLRELEPSIGGLEQLKVVQEEIRERMRCFVPIGAGESPTAFFASDLTRQHLREVVRFFVASGESGYLVPFQRLGTGTVNTLVFALLTFIADLKRTRSVIFAMEEPEIALPPHTQRRIVQFVLGEMGQAIVTSHSPYVIERFDSTQVVVLERRGGGELRGQGIDPVVTKAKTFRTQRRQLAEAVLSRAVLVVEGGTELALLPAVSAALEEALGRENYSHIDLAGVSLFDAGSDSQVPKYGPIFESLGKTAFAMHDKPKRPFTDEQQGQLARYRQLWDTGYSGIEELLVEEVATAALRRFLKRVAGRSDYPHERKYERTSSDEDVKDLALRVLRARKGDSYAYCEFLIEQCDGISELPKTVAEMLQRIHVVLCAERVSQGEEGPLSYPVEGQGANS